MKTQPKIVKLVLLSMLLLVRTPFVNATTVSLDNAAVQLSKAYSGSENNIGAEFRLAFSAESADAVSIPVGRDAIVIVGQGSGSEIKAFKENGISFATLRELIMSKSSEISFSNLLAFEKLSNFLSLQGDVVPDFKEFKHERLAGSINIMLFSELGKDLFANNNSFQLIPIDRNGNGRLEENESFYSDYEDFSRAVWLGKYPKALSFTLYAAVDANAATNSQFISWLYSSGQEVIAASGFMPLNSNEIQANIVRMQNVSLPVQETATAAAIPTWIIFVIVIAVLAVIAFMIVLSITRPKDQGEVKVSAPGAFGAASFNLENGRLYDKTHTWAFLEEKGTVRVGLDDFINKLFGRSAELELLKPGDRVIKGDIMATIVHLGRKVSVKAPVSGKIVAINTPKSGHQSNIKADWIYRIEPENWSREQSFLYMADQHRDWLKTEFLRFREFVADAMRIYNQKESQAIMLDGGEMIEGVMQYVEPQVWEDFQKSFMQISL